MRSLSAPLTGAIGGLVAAYTFILVGLPAACMAVTATMGLFTVGYAAVGRRAPRWAVRL